MAHPDTYVNKIVLGSSCGALALYNFRSGKRLHTFKSCAGAGGITALAPSPALDVVAVGRADGTISLLHLRQDKLVFKLKAQGGPVTSLAFRTDAGAGSGAGGESATMASGAGDGRVWLWDLGERNLR